MSESISRRDALKQFALLCGAAGVLHEGRPAQAADELPHLAPDDPLAVALKYHADATTVDPKTFSTYQAGQTCSTCLQLQGTAGAAWRPCSLFPGKLVNANGWCSVWVKKS